MTGGNSTVVTSNGTNAGHPTHSEYLMKTKRNLLVGLAIVVILGGVSAGVKRLVTARAIKAEVNEFYDSWGKLKYVSVAESSRLQQRLDELIDDPGLDLDAAQRGSLKAMLEDFVEGFATGDSQRVSSFFGLKELSGVRQVTHFELFSTGYPTNFVATSPGDLSRTYMEYWEALRNSPASNRFCFDCFQGVAAEEVKVRVFPSAPAGVGMEFRTAVHARGAYQEIGVFSAKEICARVAPEAENPKAVLVVLPIQLKNFTHEHLPFGIYAVWSPGLKRWFPINLWRGGGGLIELTVRLPL